MTTTAHEDQYTVAPEPVRQPYDTVAILRRNVADLELALKRQTELKEKAEAELAKAAQQEPVAWRHENGNIFLPWQKDLIVTGAKFSPLYAAPVTAPAVPNEIGLGKGEFVIWPVKIGGVHGLAFVKTKDPKAVGTFHAEPEDGQIELGAGDSVIHFGNAESAAVLADRLQHVISLMNPANAAPVPMPAVPELDPITRLIVSDPKQLKPKKQEPAVPYGIDEEAANRIALAVYDCKNGINQEPLLYAINRILATEAHPLSAEGQRSLLQSAEGSNAAADRLLEGGNE